MTPLATAFRAFSGGGTRMLIDQIDDSQTMQQTNKSTGMHSEKWPEVESPQNYGFTSVVAQAMKGASGMIQQSAEAMLSFMGGNRSFPMAGVMDDPRHRLLNLLKDAAAGSSALYGLKEWGQQFLNTEKGMYMTGNTEKMLKFALVENKNGQKQQSQSGGGGSSSGSRSVKPKIINPPGSYRNAAGKLVVKSEFSGIEFDVEELPHAELRAEGGSGGSGGGGSGNQSGGGKPTGQKTLHKEQSNIYTQFDNKAIFTKHGDGYANVTPDISQTYHKDPKHDTRCDKNHVHIGWEEDKKIWVDKDGCWSSKPIRIRNCDDQNSDSGSGPPAESGPPAYSADSPMSIDDSGNLSMAVTDPIAVMSSLTRAIHNPVPGIGPRTVEPLGLKFKAPLFLDSEGFLTSTGGGTGGVPEAPINGLMYGRKDANWARALAIDNDVLDGGTF
jgi:hypothetical protein